MSNFPIIMHPRGFDNSSLPYQNVGLRRGAGQHIRSTIKENGLLSVPEQGRPRSRTEDRFSRNGYSSPEMPDLARLRSYSVGQVHNVALVKAQDGSIVEIPVMLPFVPAQDSYLGRFPPGALQNLQRQLLEFYTRFALTEDAYNSRLSVVKRLQTIFRQKLPNSGLYVIGSTITGLGSADADMDLCWMLSEDGVISQDDAVSHLRSALETVNAQETFAQKIQLYVARVPILRFVCAENGVQCEVNVNQSCAIRNTYLLCHYARLDPRVRPLSIAVKIWAQRNGLCDAWKGGLSSYSWELLLINYLQVCCPAVLPSLQALDEEKFAPKRKIQTLVHHPFFDSTPNWRSGNLESLAALLIGFFRYYSEVFDFSKDIASVRFGTVAKVADWPGFGKKLINIEEPYDGTNTARGVTTDEDLFRIRGKFRETTRMLLTTFDIRCLTPERPPETPK